MKNCFYACWTKCENSSNLTWSIATLKILLFITLLQNFAFFVSHKWSCSNVFKSLSKVSNVRATPFPRTSGGRISSSLLMWQKRQQCFPEEEKNRFCLGIVLYKSYVLFDPWLFGERCELEIISDIMILLTISACDPIRIAQEFIVAHDEYSDVPLTKK